MLVGLKFCAPDRGGARQAEDARAQRPSEGGYDIEIFAVLLGWQGSLSLKRDVRVEKEGKMLGMLSMQRNGMPCFQVQGVELLAHPRNSLS